MSIVCDRDWISESRKAVCSKLTDLCYSSAYYINRRKVRIEDDVLKTVRRKNQIKLNKGE